MDMVTENLSGWEIMIAGILFIYSILQDNHFLENYPSQSLLTIQNLFHF